MTDDNTKHDSFYRSTGEKIKRIRERNDITLQEMTKLCGMPKATISNYENDNRIPDTNRREIIAKALGVSELALKDHKIETVLDSLYALFDMESRGDVFPCQTENGNYALCMNDAKLSKALMEWYGMYQKFNDHTITLNEYLDWKDQYPQIPVSQKQTSAVLQQQSTEPEYEMIVINGKKYKLTPVE